MVTKGAKSAPPVTAQDNAGGMAIGVGGTITNLVYGFGSTSFALQGISWKDLSDRADVKASLCLQRAHDHEVAAYNWRRAAEPLSWVTAVLAAISGLAVVGDNLVVAPWLAIATAFAAATNAALSPAETARKRRNAGLAYERLRLKVEDFQLFDLKVDTAAVPDEKLIAIRETFRKFDEEGNAIAEGSPPLRGV